MNKKKNFNHNIKAIICAVRILTFNATLYLRNEAELVSKTWIVLG